MDWSLICQKTLHIPVIFMNLRKKFCARDTICPNVPNIHEYYALLVPIIKCFRQFLLIFNQTAHK